MAEITGFAQSALTMVCWLNALKHEQPFSVKDLTGISEACRSQCLSQLLSTKDVTPDVYVRWHSHTLIQLYNTQMNGQWLTDNAQILEESGDPPLSNKTC